MAKAAAHNRSWEVRRGTVILRRGLGEVQCGTDPRWSVRLTGLTEEQEEWLRSLIPGSVPPTGCDDTLRTTLIQAGVLVRAGGRRSAAVRAPAGGTADLGVLSALRPDGAGRLTLAHRATATVGVNGLGRLGAALAGILATAGIGAIGLDDRSPVLATDVAAGAYRLTEVGLPREQAARRIITDVAPAVRVASATAPDVVVVIEHGAADIRRYTGLMGEGITHLPVVIREADVVIGPLVHPGRTPCVRCVDLHEVDRDPSWPALLSQLRGRHPTAVEETVLAASGAAVAAGQVLAAVDGLPAHTAAAHLEIVAPNGVPRLRPVARHRSCGCGDLADTPPDGGPMTGPDYSTHAATGLSAT